MNIFIVDFQGFGNLNTNFILKEIAIFHNGQHHHFIITPPFHKNQMSFSLQRQAHWLIKNFHGLTWDCGFTNFSEVRKFLFNKLRCGKAYVKGIQKAHWLRRILDNPNVEVINIEDIYSCPRLDQLRQCYPIQIKCENHELNCALQNVYLLKKALYSLKRL